MLNKNDVLIKSEMASITKRVYIYNIKRTNNYN